jgi:hypothetical protein
MKIDRRSRRATSRGMLPANTSLGTSPQDNHVFKVTDQGYRPRRPCTDQVPLQRGHIDPPIQVVCASRPGRMRGMLIACTVGCVAGPMHGARIAAMKRFGAPSPPVRCGRIRTRRGRGSGPRARSRSSAARGLKVPVRLGAPRSGFPQFGPLGVSLPYRNLFRQVSVMRPNARRLSEANA